MILIVVAVVGVDGFVIYIYTHTNVIYVYRRLRQIKGRKIAKILIMQTISTVLIYSNTVKNIYYCTLQNSFSISGCLLRRKKTPKI